MPRALLPDRSDFLDALYSGPGHTEYYLNQIASSKTDNDVVIIKRCVQDAVRDILGDSCTVQGAGSTYRSVAIAEVGPPRHLHGRAHQIARASVGLLAARRLPLAGV
jgi:hypothetical protein